MSTVYATEPAPSGRILLETTHGPLDIELWCRECPTTTRWIMQLVLDGYYTSNVFHRILSNTLIQCGAMQYNTESAGDNDDDKTNATISISPSEWAKYRNHANVNAARALERQRFELNSRLRFSHRGIAALALSLDDTEDDDARALLHSQFFCTLGEADYLDGKHVIFGRLSGPTIFNAIRIGQNTAVEDANDNHNTDAVDYSEAPRIVQAKILDNPIHTDLKATPDKFIPWKNKINNKKDSKKKKKKRKGKYDVNVLSFGDELEEGQEFVPKSKKAKKSSSKEIENIYKDNENDDDNQREKKFDADAEDKKEQEESNHLPSMTAEEAEQKFQQMAPSFVSAQTRENEDKQKKQEASSKQQQDQEQQSTKKASSKKKKLSGASLLEAMRNKAQYSNAAGRGDGKKKKSTLGGGGGNDTTGGTLSKLMAFQSRMGGDATSQQYSNKNEPQDNSLAARMARKAQQQSAAHDGQGGSNPLAVTYTGQVLEADPRHAEEEYNRDWMSTKFQCRKHVDQFNSNNGDGNDENGADEAADGRQMDEYQVIDDREKGNNKGGGDDGRHRDHHKRRDGDRHHRRHRDHDRSGGHRGHRRNDRR